MPKLIRDVLTKVCHLCKARGFVFERSFNLSDGNVTALDYGPLGIEIKRNLLNEWWHEVVTSRENVYGLDLALPGVYNQTIQQEAAGIALQHLSSYLADTYQYACKLIEIQGNESPTGLAQNLTISQSGNANIDEFMFRYVPYFTS
jgi:hypothetical protein